MKGLVKQQVREKQKLQDALTSAKDELEIAIDAYHSVVAEAWSEVEVAHQKLQEAIEAANEFRDGVYTQQEDYYCERSETWQEGDAGQAYDSWKDEWSNELEVPEIEKPDDLEMPDVEAVEAFEQLPEAP